MRFWSLFFLVSIASFNLNAESKIQEITDNIPPGHWDEELLKRSSSAVFGSTKHNLILKSKKLENDNFEEFYSQLKLYKILQEYDPNHALQKRAGFLEPKDLRVYPEISRYFFVMERLYPIRERKFKTLQRVYLGCKNNLHDIKKPTDFAIFTPNNYFSYAQVEEILSTYPQLDKSRTNIEQLCYDLGTLLALVHLKAKLDGFNMEIALAKLAKDYKLVLLDFDRARDLSALFATKDEKIIIQALLKTTMLEYYYPFPTTKGFKHFRKGYLSVAVHLDKKNEENFYLPLAKNFFREYISTWLRKKFSGMYATENSTKENIRCKELLNEKDILEKIVRFIEQKDFYVQEEEIFNQAITETGKVIVLYGTPCAGKSTIAVKLVEKMPKSFKIIKREEITNQILSDYIEKATNIRPKDHEQLLIMGKELSKKYKFNLRSHCKEYAIMPTIEKIRERSLKGENIIFDICLYDPKYLSDLKDLNAEFVLVYCPLPELFKRKNIRDSKKNQKSGKNEHLLAGFLDLYEPSENSRAIDTIRRVDLIDLKEPYSHFKPETPIAPKHNFGLVVDSSQNCPDTTADIIISRLKYQ